MTGRRLGEASSPADSVTRWNALHAEFPEAAFTYAQGFFIGALRDADDVLRSPTLDGLRERLLTRERYPDGPH